jgi:hypothetical protein
VKLFLFFPHVTSWRGQEELFFRSEFLSFMSSHVGHPMKKLLVCWLCDGTM